MMDGGMRSVAQPYIYSGATASEGSSNGIINAPGSANNGAVSGAAGSGGAASGVSPVMAQAVGTVRMNGSNKRRRIDGAQTPAGQAPFVSQQYSGPSATTSSLDPQLSAALPARQVLDVDNFNASTLNERGDAANANSSSWSRLGRPAYPEVTGQQQPFYQQTTDPATYLSPWPPTEGGHTGVETSAALAPTKYHLEEPTNNMPYFPSVQQQPDYGSAQEPSSFDLANENAEHQNSGLAVQYAFSSSERQSPPQPNRSSGPYLHDASMHLKIQSLPILDNLATQLIQGMSKATFPQIQDILRGSETEKSQAFTTLKDLFDQTRKVYSRGSTFIDAVGVQIFQPSQQEIIRKANVATFISGILGSHDISFYHLNEFFLETFVPLGHRLLKWQGAIYLELKTQAYISALRNSDGSPEAMLDELFPYDVDAQVLSRHPDAPSLSPSEQDFVDRSRSRKAYLLAEPSVEQALHELPRKYQWLDFVREFASAISKNIDSVMSSPARTQPVFAGAVRDRWPPSASDSAAQTGNTSGPGQQSAQSTVQADDRASTDVSLPDKKPLPSSTSSSVRQPWTKAEEEALLEGLDRVSGPHWSQILALYGRGGSVSEVLKDRNQVQLKDKARNLKLWYLKMGKEVPVALRGVTGELRKRGGARARAALAAIGGEEEGGEGVADVGDEGGGGESGDAGDGEGGRPAKVKAEKGVGRKKGKAWCE